MAPKVAVSALLVRCASLDQDERYMGFSDLAAACAEGSLGEELERRVLERVLAGLEDPSNNVQSMAVKCLPALYATVGRALVADMGAKLTALLLDEERVRMGDLYSIGLQALVRGAPEPMGDAVWGSAFPGLLGGLGASPLVAERCVEALTELLRRWGARQPASHEACLEALAGALEGRAALRKRAVPGLCALAAVASDALLERVVRRVAEGAQQDRAERRAYVQAVGGLAKGAGHRLGKFLPLLVPLLRECCGRPEEDGEEELREGALAGLEALALKCPLEALPFAAGLLDVALAFGAYDPNYCQAEEDEEEAEEEQGDEEEEDESWRVRRAALRLLCALLSGRLLPAASSSSVLDALLLRCSDRQEPVRCEALHALGLAAELAGAELRFDRVAAAACKELAGGSARGKAAALLLLKRYAALPPSAAVDLALPQLLTSAGAAATDPSPALRAEATDLLCALLAVCGRPAALRCFPSVLPNVLAAVGRDGGRAAAEALRLLELMVPLALGPALVLAAVLPVLRSTSVDAETKERAMGLAAALVCAGQLDLGDASTVLQQLLAKVDDEGARVGAIRALAAVSAAGADLSFVAERLLRALSGLLRQQNRVLREAALHCLAAALANPSSSASEEVVLEICRALAPLLSDGDGAGAQAAVRVAAVCVRRFPSTAGPVKTDLYPRLAALIASAAPQDSAKLSFIELINELLLRNALTFAEAVASLRELATPQASKASIHWLARAVAGICADEGARLHTVRALLGELAGEGGRAHTLLVLLAAGELGTRTDLGAVPELQEALFAAFESSAEEVWSAASFALGRAAAGCPRVFLPLVLQFADSARFQFQLLAALRELLSFAEEDGALDARALRESALPPLLRRSADQDRVLRAVVAECLGLLAALDHLPMLAVFRQLCSDEGDKVAMTTAACALRYLLLRSHTSFQTPDFSDLLAKLLSDNDLAVREESLRMLNSCLHKNSALVLPLLSTFVLPRLIETLASKQIVEIDLGPFKQKNDLCLPLRRLSLDCICSVLQLAPQEIDVSKLLEALPLLLKDEESIRLYAHKVVVKLSELFPAVVLSKIVLLIEPFQRTIPSKAPENKKGVELERALEVVRSAVKTVYVVDSIPGSEFVPQWVEFLVGVKSAPLVLELQKDSC